MSVLLDTNVLLRFAQTASPDHATAIDAVRAIEQASLELCIVPQVIYEFWVVATRPLAANGLEMSAISVEASIQLALRRFHLLKDERGIYSNWYNLVVANEVKGKTAHDARLVAAMQRHRLSNLLTFNKADFARFSSISVYTPAEVVAGQIPS